MTESLNQIPSLCVILALFDWKTVFRSFQPEPAQGNLSHSVIALEIDLGCKLRRVLKFQRALSESEIWIGRTECPSSSWVTQNCWRSGFSRLYCIELRVNWLFSRTPVKF
jgi:hypothetical protein